MSFVENQNAKQTSADVTTTLETKIESPNSTPVNSYSLHGNIH